MIRKSKYVVGLARAGYIEKVVAVIFPEDVNHADLAMAVFGSKNRILGAGFCDVIEREGEMTAAAYGDSVSLGVASRVEDIHYLNEALGFGYGPITADVLRKDRETVMAQVQAANAKIGLTNVDCSGLPKAVNE